MTTTEQCPHIDQCPLLRPKSKFGLSEEFKKAILSAGKPMYQISAAAKVAPAILSKGVNGKYFFKPNDKRIERIALEIGFQGSCLKN